MFSGAIKPWHILVLIAVLVLLFGARKLPDAARGLGRSLRIIKAETKSLREEGDKDGEKDGKEDRKPDIPDNEAAPLDKPESVTKSSDR